MCSYFGYCGVKGGGGPCFARYEEMRVNFFGLCCNKFVN